MSAVSHMIFSPVDAKTVLFGRFCQIEGSAPLHSNQSSLSLFETAKKCVVSICVVQHVSRNLLVPEPLRATSG